MFWDVRISGAEEVIHAESPLRSASNSFTVAQFLSLKLMWFTRNHACLTLQGPLEQSLR